MCVFELGCWCRCRAPLLCALGSLRAGCRCRERCCVHSGAFAQGAAACAAARAWEPGRLCHSRVLARVLLLCGAGFRFLECRGPGKVAAEPRCCVRWRRCRVPLLCAQCHCYYHELVRGSQNLSISSKNIRIFCAFHLWLINEKRGNLITLDTHSMGCTERSIFPKVSQRHVTCLLALWALSAVAQEGSPEASPESDEASEPSPDAHWFGSCKQV